MNNKYIDHQIKKLFFGEIILILLMTMLLYIGYKDGGFELLFITLLTSILSIIICMSTNSIRKAFNLPTIIDKSRILKIIYWITIMIVLILSGILSGISKGNNPLINILPVYTISFGITIIHFSILTYKGNRN